MRLDNYELQRGDLLEISWVDIFEDPAGNPDRAALARRTSWGLFWGRKDDAGVPVIVTTTTLDPGSPDQQGFCIYPEACVRKLTVVKRRRRRVPRSGRSLPETGTAT